jgi:Mn2+/Fe2+ NRAMP family transporter
MNWINKLFRSVLGPSAVIAAGTMGAGAVSTLILAGAWFRYDLLWVILFMLPLFVVVVDSSSRIGSINQGEGMMTIVSRRIHPSVAWLLLLINVPVHLLVAMGQFSIMTSAFLSLFGMHPPVMGAPQAEIDQYLMVEIITSILLAFGVLWLMLFNGYDRMQKAMTVMLVMMFFCFFIIAMRSFGEAGDILAGFIPNIPEDLAVPGRGTVRLTTGSIIAIVGSAIAPGALLTIPYLSSDASAGSMNLKRDLNKSILNLGVIFGIYAMFIVIAGGYALFPLANNAEIETVHQAGQVMNKALPDSISFIGPGIFTFGLLIAAITTLVICVQVCVYLTLDMLKKRWTFTVDNKPYRWMLVVVTLLAGALAPVWGFPAMLKVVLLMGVNVLVIPLVITVMIFLLNRKAVMGEHTASPIRNSLLVLCLIVAVVLAVGKIPDYLAMF